MALNLALALKANALAPVLVPSWVLNGAAADLDFVNGRYFTPTDTTLAGLIACSRASTALAQKADGSWLSFAADTPRITDQGLLVEEARTNSIRNNSMAGAAAGTPGTLPTNWSLTGLGTLTQQITAVGIEGGVPYIEIRLSGTTSTTQLNLLTEGNQQIAASNGQVWTTSVFIKRTGGATTNIGSIRAGMFANNAAGTGVQFNDNTIAPATTGPLGSARASFPLTLTDATTAFVNQRAFTLNFSSGVAIDITLRVGAPQLELGGFATSPILTSSAAVTRATDIVTLSGAATSIALAARAARFETNAVNINTTSRLISFSGGFGYLALGGSITQATIQSIDGLTAISPDLATGTTSGLTKTSFSWDASGFSGRATDEAFGHVRAALVTRLFETAQAQAPERERLYQTVQVLDAVREALLAAMGQGQAAIDAYVKGLAKAD